MREACWEIEGGMEGLKMEIVTGQDRDRGAASEVQAEVSGFGLTQSQKKGKGFGPAKQTWGLCM